MSFQRESVSSCKLWRSDRGGSADNNYQERFPSGSDVLYLRRIHHANGTDNFLYYGRAVPQQRQVSGSWNRIKIQTV